jgi:hypothetical protein
MASDVRETAKKGEGLRPQHHWRGGSQRSNPRKGRRNYPNRGIEDGHAPRIQRTSAVTLTISEGAKTTYAEIIATARRSIPLTEIGVKSIRMRKAVTGAIIIKVQKEGSKRCNWRRT